MGLDDPWLNDDLGRVKFKGVFDLNGMFRMMRSYLKYRGYDFYETLHKAKVPELEVEWYCEKKVTGYDKYKVEIKFHFFDLKQVEVEENGEKKLMTNGRFSIEFDGEVERGYSSEWNEKESLWNERLKLLYHRITRKEWMVNHAQTLIDEIVELRDKTNAYLGMVASH